MFEFSKLFSSSILCDYVFFISDFYVMQNIFLKKGQKIHRPVIFWSQSTNLELYFYPIL